MSIYSVSVCYCSHLCKVYWSAVNNWRKALFSNLDLFLSQAQKQHSTGKLQFLWTKLFMHVHQSLRANDFAPENDFAAELRYGTGKNMLKPRVLTDLAWWIIQFWLRTENRPNIKINTDCYLLGFYQNYHPSCLCHCPRLEIATVSRFCLSTFWNAT